MELRKYKIRDVQSNGISKVIAVADEEGMVVVTRNSIPSALILSLSRKGMAKVMDNLREVVQDIPEDDGKMLLNFLDYVENL